MEREKESQKRNDVTCNTFIPDLSRYAKHNSRLMNDNGFNRRFFNREYCTINATRKKLVLVLIFWNIHY